MRKLLAVGALAVIALLLLILHELHAPVDAAAATPPPSAPVIAPSSPVAAPVASAPRKAAPAPAPDVDGKINLNSDDFIDRFVDRQPRLASKAAMSCYHGGLDRKTMNQWIRFSFVGHIKNGEVTFSDVTVKESKLDDPALESCMLAAVARAHWHDDSLPDVDRYEDETTLNPERGGQKYLHAADDTP